MKENHWIPIVITHECVVVALVFGLDSSVLSGLCTFRWGSSLFAASFVPWSVHVWPSGSLIRWGAVLLLCLLFASLKPEVSFVCPPVWAPCAPRG